MPRPLVSCPTQTGSALTTAEPCGPQLISRISIDHEANRCMVWSRSAETQITLSQLAPGVWVLSASNTLNLSQSVSKIKVITAPASTVVQLKQDAVLAGGRVYQNETRCVDQVAHGLSKEDWIILDKTTLDWTQAFDPTGDIKDDAVAQVVEVQGPDCFCYRPIGPIIDNMTFSLTPGETYYVETDGSGDLTLTEPTDVSVPRICAISPTEAILLPYRPIDPSTISGGTHNVDVFDVDNTIATTKQVTLTGTPVTNSEFVFVNGLLATPGASRDYTIAAATITFDASCDLRVGDLITVKYET